MQKTCVTATQQPDGDGDEEAEGAFENGEGFREGAKVVCCYYVCFLHYFALFGGLGLNR